MMKKQNILKKTLAFGLVASMAPVIGIAKPKDKEESTVQGNAPVANAEKQALKAVGEVPREAERKGSQAPPQAVQAREKVEQPKPGPTQAQPGMPRPASQRNLARQVEDNATNERDAVAVEQERAKAMQQQTAERSQRKEPSEEAREQQERAESAQANARERAEAMKDRAENAPGPDVPERAAEQAEAAQTNASERGEGMRNRAEKGPKPQVVERGEERSKAAQGKAREGAGAMKGAATDSAPPSPENAEREAERVAGAAEGRGKAMRPENGERGEGNVVNAEERLKRAKERANMSDRSADSTGDAAENARERAGRMKESTVTATGDSEESRERNMRRNPEAAESADEREATRTKRMSQATRQEVADTETEARLAEADTAEKANVTPEAVQQRRQKARQGRTQQTTEVLRDQRRRDNRDQQDEFQRRARDLEDDDDALELIAAAIGGFAVGAVTSDLLDNDDDYYRHGRLPLSQVGRTHYEREASVAFLRNRFLGRASYDDAPVFYDSPYWNRNGDNRGHYPQPYFYDNNVRVVRYSSYDAVPPVLLGYQKLNRVQVANWTETPYYGAEQPEYYQNLPDAYRSEDSYAVSYPVDPDSAVTQDDILFEQGSTSLADAYSYDLIVDIAEAVNSSELQNERFVIEGHASREGAYASNQALSQDRAERIASDLVDLGVAADRLIPVGYGESEAQYPAEAPESQRELDRRVMVFRLEE